MTSRWLQTVPLYGVRCADSPSGSGGSSCDFELHKDVDLRRPDQVRSAFSADQCRSMCETSREFACRSFSFAPASGVCAMSGDDTVSLGGFALRMTPGVGYYQRPTCPERTFLLTPVLATRLFRLNLLKGVIPFRDRPSRHVS